ncbi:MAG: hypothetical protein WCV68_01275 [Candidatus Paceibacterota bacterium]|jgi:hypothetical protein
MSQEDFFQLGNKANQEGGEKHYRVMTPEDVVRYREWAKERVKTWHDEIAPDHIFLTETSAVPFGWLLRNTWRQAYPNEKAPNFFRFAMDRGNRGYFCDNNKIYKDYEEKRGINKNEKILIYDETNRGCEKAINNVKDGVLLSEMGCCGQLDEIVDIFRMRGYQNIWNDAGQPKTSGFYINDWGGYSYLFYDNDKKFNSEQERDEEKEGRQFYYVKPTRKRRTYKGKEINIGRDLVGEREKDPVLRRRALDYIHDLKLVGDEAGAELRVELA